MKNHMAERLISLCLTAVFMTTPIMTAQAQEAAGSTDAGDVAVVDVVSGETLDDKELDKDLAQTIDKDVAEFQEMGLIDISDEFVASVDEEGEVTYELKAGEYENTISVLQNDKSAVKLSVEQDDITNEFIINADGTMILDGNEIDFGEVETEIVEDNIQEDSAEGGIAPMASNVINRLTPTCPYGKASDYTYKLGSKSNKSLYLQNEIIKISFTVFIPIISKQLGVPKVLGNAVKNFYYTMRKKDPHSKYMSYKVTNYAHKNYKNTYIKPVKLYGFKSNYTWYTKASYKGTAVKETLYQTKQMN